MARRGETPVTIDHAGQPADQVGMLAAGIEDQTMGGQKTALADLRLAVAVDLAPTVDDYLADADDIVAVINDAVACWQALPADVRAHYETQQLQHPVNRFLCDYVAEVDAEPSTNRPDGGEMDAWRHHASRLRGRPAPPADALTIGAGPTPAARALIVYHNARIREALHASA